MQVSNNPLLIEDRAAVKDTNVRRGATLRRELTIQNLGSEADAIVNFWLETTDPKAESLLSWYSFSPNPPLNVKRDEPYKVTLNFEVPQYALPGIYNYAIVFEAAQYPGKSFRRPLQLQVSSSEHDLTLDADPGFTLEPITTSAKPYSLNANESFKLTVKLENRSKLVDRFYLTCPELTRDWFTVVYPESAAENLGVVQEADGLPLLPKSSGEITLLLHPPQYTPAGNYFPTIQLTSKNNEAFVLLDVVYLQLLPDDRLNLQLNPLRRVVPEEPGAFELTLINLGNIERKLVVHANDHDKVFTYLAEPSIVALSPGTSQALQLIATPKHWWQRPLRGKGLAINFDVELENAYDPFLLESIARPALPDVLPQGALTWQARPWWLLWLLILLPLMALGGIALALWLQYSKHPEVLTFTTTNAQVEYQEGKGEPIRLDWSVTDPEHVDKITVTRLERGTETYRKSYYFNQKQPDQTIALIPKILQKPEILQKKTIANNYCKLAEAPEEKSGLRPAIAFYSLFNFIQLPYPSLKRGDRLSTLECKGILPTNKVTDAQKAGSYTFQIQVFKSQQEKPVDSKMTDTTITVKPNDEPKIEEFASTQTVYEERSAAVSIANTDNSTQTLLNRPTAAQTNAENVAPGLVRLNWKILNASRIAEIRLVSLAPDGSTQGELKRYPIVEGRLPPQLSNVCDPLDANLVCRNVPTDAQKPGDYIFKLVVVVKQEEGTTEITKSTEPIKIKPKAIKIISFKINGKEAAEKPKHVYLLNEQGDTVEVVLYWIVEGGEGIQVELSPSPGRVSARGSINYTLTPPSTETITLKATNKSGDQQSQAVVIQTIMPQEATQLPTLPPPPPGEAVKPVPSKQNQLAPLDLPPQPN